MFLILYDISDNNIRTKIAKRLIAEGYERIQLSVFTGPSSPILNTLLWSELQTWLSKEPSSKLLVVPVPVSNFKNLKHIGSLGFDLEELLSLKNCIFI